MSDTRFAYSDPNASKKYPQYITGNEITILEARNSPTEFPWGSTFEFPVPDGPFLISDKNYIKMQIRFERKATAAPAAGQAPHKWQGCQQTDLANFFMAENFGSYMIEDVTMRQGLDNLETHAFVPRGRFLYENLLMAHSDISVKRAYAYKPTDPAMYNFMDITSFTATPESEAYKACFKSNNTTNKMMYGMAFRVVPHALPFQSKNRSTMHETLFPNTGQPLSIVIKLINNDKNLYYVYNEAKDDTQKLDYEYRIRVVKMQLVLAIPRFSSAGLQLITNRNHKPLHWDGNYVVQYTQNVVNSPEDIHFSFQGIPLPHYVIIQTFNQEYFTGDPQKEYWNVAHYKPLQMNVQSCRIRYGNKDLNYHTANFTIQDPESAILRQNIMKHSNVFDSKLMDQTYYENMENYQQHHYLFSFCSDESNQTLLRPMDYTANPETKQTLSFALLGNATNKMQNGKLLITLIFKDIGLDYNIRTGQFVHRDIKSLMFSN